MRSRIAKRNQYESTQNTVERVQGRTSTLTNVAATQYVQSRIVDAGRLPAEQDSHFLSDDDGNNMFVLGYSALGGDDVLA